MSAHVSAAAAASRTAVLSCSRTSGRSAVSAKPAIRSLSRPWAMPTRRPLSSTRATKISDYTSTEYENQKVDEYVALFKQADKDGNGRLDREELMLLLESFEGGLKPNILSWLAPGEMDRVLEQYDSDNSGDISLEEFTSMMRDEVLLDGKLEEYEAAFRAADVSGNGSLGASELADMFESLGQPVSYMQLFRTMEKYDKDGNGQIDFSEFLNMFREQLMDLNAILDYVQTNPGDQNCFAQTTSRLVNAEPGEVTLIFSAEELDDIQEGNKGKVVCLMASLTWCRPCKGFSRNFQRLAEHYSDVRFVKFYGNSNENTKALFKDELKVKGTPWFYLFKDGAIIGESSGANGKRLEENLRKVLPADQCPDEVCIA